MRYTELENAFLLIAESPAEVAGLIANLPRALASPLPPVEPPVSGLGPTVRWRSPYSIINGRYNASTRVIEVLAGTRTDRVEFFMDEKRLSVATKAPWRAIFDSRLHANGKHKLHAVGFSESGFTRITRDVTVKN